MNRGDIYDVDFPAPAGRRPGVVVTRDDAIPVLRNVCVAPVTSRTRGLRTEVAIGIDDGLTGASVVNCDNLFTLPKDALGRRRGSISPERIPELDDALRIALDLD